MVRHRTHSTSTSRLEERYTMNPIFGSINQQSNTNQNTHQQGITTGLIGKNKEKVQGVMKENRNDAIETGVDNITEEKLEAGIEEKAENEEEAEEMAEGVLDTEDDNVNLSDASQGILDTSDWVNNPRFETKPDSGEPEDAGNALGDAAEGAGNALGDAWGGVTGAAEDAGNALGDAAGGAANAAQGAGNFLGGGFGWIQENLKYIAAFLGLGLLSFILFQLSPVIQSIFGGGNS